MFGLCLLRTFLVPSPIPIRKADLSALKHNVALTSPELPQLNLRHFKSDFMQSLFNFADLIFRNVLIP